MMAEELTFINSLYDESMGLLVEARNYFQHSETNRKAQRSHTPQDKLFVNYQAMRLTSRLTQAMAWLLAQRAVQTGELTMPEACGGNFSLGGEAICTTLDDHTDHRLPGAMQRLLDRSHSIYMRVWRLDQQTQQRLEQMSGH